MHNTKRECRQAQRLVSASCAKHIWESDAPSRAGHRAHSARPPGCQHCQALSANRRDIHNSAAISGGHYHRDNVDAQKKVLSCIALESIIQSNACHELMPCQENTNDSQHWLTESRQRSTMYAASCIIHHTKHTWHRAKTST